jgi:hypothetical protein
MFLPPYQKQIYGQVTDQNANRENKRLKPNAELEIAAMRLSS